ncbi:hypothetical protein [Mesobacillus harenae]|uniref:hypothetical protein n=1 Tax=Mesobacillus harenae TaxID=2213203 RepID=UPI0015804A24|nr:hypothetical protein [Mesobacillus harenae]
MRKLSLVLLVYFSSIIVLNLLSYFADAHPYGFNFEETKSGLEVKIGIFDQESYLISSEESDLQSELLKWYINDHINMWIAYINVLSIFVAGLLGFFKEEFRAKINLKLYAVGYLVLLAAVILVGIRIFTNQGAEITKLINALT